MLGCPTHPRDHHHPEQSKAHRPSKQIKGWIHVRSLSSTPKILPFCRLFRIPIGLWKTPVVKRHGLSSGDIHSPIGDRKSISPTGFQVVHRKLQAFWSPSHPDMMTCGMWRHMVPLPANPGLPDAKKTAPLQWHCEVLLASVAYQLWTNCGVFFREKQISTKIKAKVLHLILSQSAHGHFIHLKCFGSLFCCFNQKVVEIFLDVSCRLIFVCRLSLRIAHIAKGQSAHRAKTLPWTSGFKGKGSKCSGYSIKSHFQGEDV